MACDSANRWIDNTEALRVGGWAVLRCEQHACIRLQIAPAVASKATNASIMPPPLGLQGWLKKRFDGMGGQIDDMFKEVPVGGVVVWGTAGGWGVQALPALQKPL